MKHKFAMLLAAGAALIFFDGRTAAAQDYDVASLSDSETLVDPVSFGLDGDYSPGCSCCPDPWVVSREPMFCYSHLDWMTDLGSSIDNGSNFKMPITGGAWHWFHQA